MLALKGGEVWRTGVSTLAALLRGASGEHSCSHVTCQPTGGRLTVTFNTLSLLAADQHDVSSCASPSSAFAFAADGFDVGSSVSFFVLRVHVTTWVIVVEWYAPLFELFAWS